MKKILIGLLMILGISLSAQTISNPDFENWSTVSVYSADTIPNQWYGMFCNTVHPTPDSYWGSLATRIQGVFACGIAQGIMINGQQPANPWNVIDGGTPFSAKPATISGFYKYTDVTNNDSAEVTVILKKFNTLTMTHDTVGIGVQSLPATNTYSLFTVNINYPLPLLTPDSIIIMFNSSKYYHFDNITMALPNLYIDRIIIPQSVAAGISESSTQMETMVYPNPSSGNPTIEIYNAGEYKDLRLHVYDVSGKTIISSAVPENKVMLSGLSCGNYLYVISTDKQVLSSGKISVR
jgi:hypothetical protein